MRTRTAPVDTELDRRGLSLRDARLELRADGSGGERFVGHAAVFDERTAIGNPLLWGFYEEIAPGAFTKTLSEGDARMLIDHDTYYVVSRVSAGTLGLAQDARGLAVDSALDESLTYVGDLKANLRNGNITGMSFGFRVVKDEWWFEEVETNDGHKATVEVRRLLELQLGEVSAVTFPAYDTTDAGLRSEGDARPRVRAEDPVAAVRHALTPREGGRELLEARSLFCPGLAPTRSEGTTPPAGAPANDPAPAAPAAPEGEPGPEPGSEPGTEPGTETPGTEPGTEHVEEPATATPAGGEDSATTDGGEEPAPAATPPTDAERVAARMRALRALVTT